MEKVGKDAAIGFFTTEHSATAGITGGFLLLNLSGRPLEFHCTLPVRPTRAHEILYGTTLIPHVVGELIGPALLERTRITPMLICIDSTDAEGLTAVSRSPIALVQRSDQLANRTAMDQDIERVIPVGDQAVAVQEALARISGALDLAEPFQRIRDALREAQQPAARAA